MPILLVLSHTKMCTLPYSMCLLHLFFRQPHAGPPSAQEKKKSTLTISTLQTKGFEIVTNDLPNYVQ